MDNHTRLEGLLSWASFGLIGKARHAIHKHVDCTTSIRDENEVQESALDDNNTTLECKQLLRIPDAVKSAAQHRLTNNNQQEDRVNNNDTWLERIVLIRSEYVARFIGRRGRNIVSLREKRLVQIKLVKIDSEINYAYIFGRATHVDEVVRLILKQLLRFKLECHCRLGVPQEYISSIIGRQGNVIQEIRDDTNARIEIPKTAPVRARGTAPGAAAASSLRRTLSTASTQSTESSTSATAAVQQPVVDEQHLTDAAENGVVADDEESESIDGGVPINSIAVNDNSKVCLVFLSGLPHHVEHAKLKIAQLVGRVYRARKRRQEAADGKRLSFGNNGNRGGGGGVFCDEKEALERWQVRGQASRFRYQEFDDDEPPGEYGSTLPPVSAATLPTAKLDTNHFVNNNSVKKDNEDLWEECKPCFGPFNYRSSRTTDITTDVAVASNNDNADPDAVSDDELDAMIEESQPDAVQQQSAPIIETSPGKNNKVDILTYNDPGLPAPLEARVVQSQEITEKTDVETKEEKVEVSAAAAETSSAVNVEIDAKAETANSIPSENSTEEQPNEVVVDVVKQQQQQVDVAVILNSGTDSENNPAEKPDAALDVGVDDYYGDNDDGYDDHLWKGEHI